MAKELEKYKKAFNTIKKDVAAANSEINKNAQALGQTVQVRDQGCLQLGLEIQRCKDAGDQGKTLRDFESDAEVKACLKSINDFQKQIEKELVRITALYNKDFADVKKRLTQLKLDLQAECNKRDIKKNRSVLPIDSQSLPDLKKLLDEAKKYADSGEFVSLDVFQPETVKNHASALEKKLQDAVKQTKDVKLNAFQQQMIQQGLDERLIKKNLTLAAKCYKELIAQCTAAGEAIKAREAKKLMEHKVFAAKEFKALSEIVDPYQRAMKDQWLRSKIRGNRETEDKINKFEKMHSQGKAELTKIANVKLD